MPFVIFETNLVSMFTLFTIFIGKDFIYKNDEGFLPAVNLVRL